ncbi:endochitinase [Martensiomyces pterosporus]|nr:endochitinase [Martensiomyces pterosporus]
MAADVIFGYLPTWQTDMAEKVDFSKYTHVAIAFAVPDENATISLDNSDSTLKEWIPKLSESNTKVLVSLGGWTGSKYFSPLMKDKDKRGKMIVQMVQWMKDYGFDGWDIDWEYPGRQGNICHEFDARADAPNFHQFLGGLREALASEFRGQSKLITLATRFQPFDGPNGPMSDVSEFARVVDYISPMLYDFNGVWSETTGPNAPFDFAQGKGLQFSFKSSIQSWIDAGVPATKIIPGVPFYGRTVTAKSDMSKMHEMYQGLTKTIPKGDGDDKEEADASCGGPKVFSGVWKYANLRSEGVLDSPGSAAAPWVRRFDSATNTPWLFNTETKDFISYDDTGSLTAKAEYAKNAGLAGIMVWSLTGDYNNELLGSIASVIAAGMVIFTDTPLTVFVAAGTGSSGRQDASVPDNRSMQAVFILA